MAGNTGTQSLGVIIALMAVNKLDEKKNILLHLLKETIIGAVNGLAIGILLFGMVLVMRLISGDRVSSSLPFAFVIGLSIAIALLASTVVGAIIPILMRLIKIDPAVASGPFITTVADIVSLLLYFSLAVWMLGMLG
jgi:magnesium transporter